MKKTLLKNNILSFSLLVFLLGSFNVSQAQNTWVGGTSTDFLDATNWSTAAPPATFLNVTTFTIGAGSPNNPVLSANYPLTSGAPTSGIITITTAGNLTTSGNINAGGVNSVDGLLTVTGGIFNGRSNFYIGTTVGSVVAVTNVEVGGTLNVKSALLISQKQAGTLNVNGGSVTTDSGGSIAVGNYGATYVDCNGILNVNAGLVKTAGALTIGSKGIVNVDAGRIELGTDRTGAMATYITNNVLKVSGAALTAGKTLSNTFDSVTGLTTIMAVLPGTAPSALNYTTTAGVYTVGTAIADNPKSALTLGTGTTATYTVSPALPAGLTLDSATGTISGTPTAAKALTTYYVKASTDYGFTTKAITIVVSAALGVNELKESAKIAVYPNPTTDFVTVSLSNAAAIQKIAVYNSLGQIVSSSVAKNTVSLQNLANGNYYLTIQTAEGSYSQKIIKK